MRLRQPRNTALAGLGTRPRRRRWYLRALLVVVGLVGSLFLVEWALCTWNVSGVNNPQDILRYRLQMWDIEIKDATHADRLDGILFKHRSGARQAFTSFTVSVNGLGFRGPEIRKQKPDNGFRILVLGDSVAFGWGVDDDVTFVRRLEHDLNRKGDGRSYEVVNTGHPLYDSTQELAMLRDHGLVLDPDLVLLVFVVNDIQPTRDLFELMLDVQAGRAPESTLGQRASLWFAGRFPATATLLAHTFRRVPAAYRDAGAAADYTPEGTELGARGWERSQRALLAMQATCKQRGIPFLVLDHSYPAVRALPEFCAANGIAYRELRFTAEELALPIYNSRIDPHSNALGHELLLGKLKRALAAEGLPPRQ